MSSVIRKTPHQERPRERCLEHGPQSLSLRECLALLLGSGPRNKGCLGVAEEILSRAGSGLHPQEEEIAFFTAMEESAASHLNEIQGLGPAGQARLLTAFELGRRYSAFREQLRATGGERELQKKSASQLQKAAVQQIPKGLRNEPKEWLGFVAFHRNHTVGRFNLVEKGVRTHVNTDAVELFARILALRPKGFFLFHNHPSGNLQPSSDDLQLTKQVQEMAFQFGIHLLGHGIIGTRKVYWIP